HRAVVRRESAVAEDRMREEIGCHHRDDEPGTVDRLSQPPDRLALLGRRRAEREHVVVVEAHAVCAPLGELRNRHDGVERGANGSTENVDSLPAYGPKTE